MYMETDKIPQETPKAKAMTISPQYGMARPAPSAAIPTSLGDLIWIENYSNAKNLSPKDFINQIYNNDCDSTLKQELVISTLMIDRHNAAEFSGECQKAIGHLLGTQVFIQNGNEVIVIAAHQPTNTNEAILKQILSTFKFIR